MSANQEEGMAAEAKPLRGRWLPLVYYYLATVVGLAILLVGLIGGLRGAVQAIFPKTSDEYRYGYGTPVIERMSPEVKNRPNAKIVEFQVKDQVLENARQSGIAESLDGLIAVIVGGPVFLWHLRQARRREPEWLGLSAQ